MAIGERFKFAGTLSLLHTIFMIMYAVFASYEDSASARITGHSRDLDKNGTDPDANPVHDYYPMFQDVHVMIFIGFGFLMTFLRKYGYSSVGLNMLIASFVIEWAMLLSGMLHLHNGHFTIGITNLLTADFAAAAVLITFGALLGKTSPLQMIIVAFVEIIAFTLNEYIGVNYIGAVDVGGSMFVHVFGAYFGLACARMIYTRDVSDNNNESSNYHSDIFAMIGTVFLWLFWPSFNSALAVGDDQHRAVINTYLALCACCLTAFTFSALLNKEGKFDMVHVQNATLAGGVAVGTSADMMINPIGALTIGSLAGVLSTAGYVYVTPFLASKLKIHDTCGVHNLHGMPGVFAGIAGAVVAAIASEDQYGYSLYQVFPMRAPVSMDNSTALEDIQQYLDISPGAGRSALEQGGYQFLALVVTLIVALVSGAITGLLLKLPVFDQPKGAGRVMADNLWWETPDDFQPVSQAPNGRSGGLLEGRDDKV